MTSTLYHLAEDYSRLMDAIDASNGELTTDIAAALNQLELSESAKAEGYVKLIRCLETRAEMRRHEANALTAAAQKDEASVRNLKERLIVYLDLTARTKLDAGVFAVRVQPTGKACVVIWPKDEKGVKELPVQFQRVTTKYEANKDALGKAFMAGEKLPPGCVAEEGRSLRIS